jgi:RNA-directed DNA polymerase
LKAAQSLGDVAKLLGYKPSSLSYVLYKIPVTQKYTIFSIPKKSGGTRQITAPDIKLKNLQRSVATLLTDCRVEIESAKPKRRSLSHGFKKGHSILTNSRPHVGRRYVFNLDLKDFFPSLNFGRVRGYFLKNNDFKLNDKAATVLTQIACYKDALPQGSPCSPIVSDLLAHILDVRLAQLAKKHGCTYSRYADDLTFSTNRKLFPREIAFPIAGQPMKWTVGAELDNKIKNSGFAINPDKTRMQHSISRQTVTGLVVNKKVNVKSEYYRVARSMCHSLFKRGQYAYKGFGGVTDFAPLEGQLSHIYFVKQSELSRSNENRPKSVLPKSNQINYIVGWQKLYGRFLFYKGFVALQQPLVICEGTTDNIYLRSALQSLGANYPSLTKLRNGKRVSAISFFKYSKHSERLLRLGGGSDVLKNFIASYADQLNYFDHAQ